MNEHGPHHTEEVRRAQAGDVTAFESLYRAHVGAVHALCMRMTGSTTDATLLVQDAFVRAWERLDSFRGDSAFGTWLHRLAANVVLERLRSNRRDALRFDDDADFSVLPGPGSTMQIETRLDLETALDTLPAGARAVFVLHDVEGYSHDEIATMLGIAAGTARAQLWRARRLMMRQLSE